MISMKKIKRVIALLAICMLSAVTATASQIPDHNGTDLSGFEIGTKKLNKAVRSYSPIFKSAGDQYGVDPNILAAVCMQESGGVNYQYYSDGTPRPAWGIMQIEYTNEKPFAAFGKDRTGTEWTLEDRLDPEKAIPYAAFLLSESLYKYDYDYIKMLQAYNFGETVLNRILAAAGDNWLDERKNAVDYVSNWPYKTYGDALYPERVLAYYHHDIDYVGAKVTLNGAIVKFKDQYPIIDNGTTLVPIRAVSEMLNAKVDWNGEKGIATVLKGDKKIELHTGTTKAYINGTPYELEVSAEVVNNRTLVPLRFVAESLDMEVFWHGETRMVELVDKGSIAIE
jgi:hypothetical protein